MKKLVALLLCLTLTLMCLPAAFAEGDKPVLRGLVVMGGVLANDVCAGPAYEAIVEKTGYELELDVYQPAETETVVNLALASRENYDFITGINATMFYNYIDNKALASLTESIEKYGADLKALFSDEVWNEFTFDGGSVYGIPSESNPRIWFTTAIRADWLETLGLEVPTTTDEFINVLRAFKEKDPAGVGSENVIPYCTSVFSGDSISYDPFLGSFGITYPWVEVDGGLTHRVNLPAFKEYVEFYKTLYDEGLIDMDLAVVKDDVLQEKVNRGVVGAARYTYYYGQLSYDMWQSEGIDYDLRFIANMKGPEGYSGQQCDTSLWPKLVVPATSDKVDDVVKFANAFAANYEYLLIGEEGVEWFWNESGTRSPILPKFNESRGDIFFYQPVMAGNIEYPLWLVRVNKAANSGRCYNEILKATEGQVQINPLAYAMNLPVTAEYSATLEKLINDTVLRIVVGDLDISALDELKTRWADEGGNAMTEEVNAWYAGADK